MPQTQQGESRARKRVSNACRRCRRHKIKCSGTDPCHVCDQKGLSCEFGNKTKKVLVSESILQDLRGRLNQLERRQGTPQSHNQPVNCLVAQTTNQQQILQIADPGFDHAYSHPNPSSNIVGSMVSPQPSARTSRQNSVSIARSDLIDPILSPEDTTDSEHTCVSNPLVPEQPAFMSDNSGNLRYLGHSSTWSFSRQVLRMAHQSPHSNTSTKVSVHVEGEAYSIELGGADISTSDIAGLPSIDLSLYYLQTVKFRTYPLFHLFDEADFTSHLHRFYDMPTSYAQSHRTWFVHYLILMAFAKAFTGAGVPASGTTSSELFSRALRFLPEVTHLCHDPVGSTELLCCVALYLQSIDHRSAANIYIGQAMRMAQSFGLHTDLQAAVIGSKLVRRGRRIWWTVYTLDRKLSCSMGHPNALRDEDLTAPFPDAEDSDINATSQTIHVKICRLLGEVVSTVYGRDGSLNKTYLNTTQTILRAAAGLANELRVFSERCFGQISRVAAQLNLAYHQCLLLTSRPFLFYILKFRLESPIPNRTFPLSSSAKGLVQVCIDSAIQIVSIVSELRHHELLDSFLPFDLECAFSAAFVLVMASNLHPKLLPQDNWLEKVMSVFDCVTLNGNILGSIRKMEVEELAEMLSGSGQGSKKISSIMMDPTTRLPTRAPSTTDQASLPSLGDPFFDEWIADDGLSGAQIMDLADALQPDGFDDLIL